MSKTITFQWNVKNVKNASTILYKFGWREQSKPTIYKVRSELLTSHWCRQQCQVSVSVRTWVWWATGRRDRWWNRRARRGHAGHSSSTTLCHAAQQTSPQPRSLAEDPTQNINPTNVSTATFTCWRPYTEYRSQCTRQFSYESCLLQLIHFVAFWVKSAKSVTCK